jgi:hypothetical protein
VDAAQPETPDAAPQPAQQPAPAVLRAAPASVAPPAAEANSRPAVPVDKQPDVPPQDSRKAADDTDSATPVVSATHIPVSPLTTPESQPPAAKSAEPTPTAEAPAPSAPTQTEPANPPVQTAAAHDIKLQVAGEGDQRVEVRVTERGGDVVVAVRTPDTRLAGDLRQELPALATKLEQSGFHATTWQPAASGEREHLADPQAAASGQDAQGQSRQNGREQQRDPEQQKQQGPENPANPAQPKEQGKDFAWLLSSIR